jgi:repressor LexA
MQTAQRPLTRRQRRVLEVIAQSIRELGRPPTLRELGICLDMSSTNGVRVHLNALMEKGYIRRDEGSARGIVLLRPPDEPSTAGAPTAIARSPGAFSGQSPDRTTRQSSPQLEAECGSTKSPPTVRRPPFAVRRARSVVVPVVGHVAAGQPVLAEHAIEDYLAFDARFVREGDVFALRVQGENMVDAGIDHGDYVFVRPQPTAEPGDIVVALVGEDATVKRFYPESGYVRLQPDNPAAESLLLRADDPNLHIVGKVAAVLKLVR